MGKRQPWLKLVAAMHADPRVRKARAGAVWPWVLCRLKDGNGAISPHDLDAFICGEDCHIGEGLAEKQLAGLKRVGLLVECEGGWTAPSWGEHQGDTSAERTRRYRERKAQSAAPDGDTAVTPVTVTPVTVTDGDVTVTTVTDVTHDGTGRDGTGQDKENTSAGAASASGLAEKLTKRQQSALPILHRWAKRSGKGKRGETITTAIGKKRLGAIAARLKDGASVEDCERVVDALTSSDWHRDNGQLEVLTAFRPDKFETWLDRAAPAKGGRIDYFADSLTEEELNAPLDPDNPPPCAW